MGKPHISMPLPTPQETALREEQTAMLRQNREILEEQTRQQQLLAPYLYKQAGITPKYNAAGILVGFEEQPDQLKDLRQSIEKGLLERSQSALAGTLPVDPALERDITENEQLLRDVMRKQLGPGWETSTPGIQAMADFTKRKEELRSSARTGQMTLAEQLGTSRQFANDLRLQNILSRTTGAVGFPFQSAGQFGTLGQLFGQAGDPYQRDRFGVMQGQYWQYNSPGQFERVLKQTGDTMGILGKLAGGIAAAGSDRRLKRLLARIGEDVRGFGIYVFRYLWSPQIHVGVIAQEVLPIIPEAVSVGPGGFLMVDYGMLYGQR